MIASCRQVLEQQVRWGRPRGLSSRSSPGASVGSTLGEGRIKDVVLCHDLRGFRSLGASPEAFDPLLPTARRCHPALPRDCLGAFWALLESFGGPVGVTLGPVGVVWRPFWGHWGDVFRFIWVGRECRPLIAVVSRQRRQVLSFKEVRISARRVPSSPGSRCSELCQVLPYRNCLMCMALWIIMSGWDGIRAGCQLRKQRPFFL